MSQFNSYNYSHTVPTVGFDLELANDLIELVPENSGFPTFCNSQNTTTSYPSVHAFSRKRAQTTQETEHQPKRRRVKSTQRNGRDDQKRDLLCRHCNTVFRGKPTWRKIKKLWTINHSCLGIKKRLQYIVGKRHRKCNHQHEDGCIDFYNEEASDSESLQG